MYDFVIQARALAKVNLSLSVTGRLENGYHLINSLVSPISLFDEITVKVAPGVGKIDVETRFSEELGAHIDYCLDSDSSINNALTGLTGENNLAHKAAKLFLSKFNFCDSVDVSIKIIKNIPFGAGLGGGSSDAASVIAVLSNALTPAIDKKVIYDMAAKIGADIPVLLFKRLAFMAGIGNRLYRVDGDGSALMSGLPALIVKPPFSVNTPAAYALFGLKPSISNSVIFTAQDLIQNQARKLAGEMLLNITEENKDFNFTPESLTTKDQEGRCVQQNCAPYFSSFVKGLENDFESVVGLAHPEIAAVKQELTHIGAKDVLLTGSGSAFVCYFSGVQEAEKFKEKLSDKRGRGWFIAQVVLEPLG